jgi:AmpD protein
MSNFFGRERCNDFSIGIELEGGDTTALEAAQYRTPARR